MSGIVMRFGKLHEDAKRFDQAFEKYVAGNAISEGFFDPAIFSQWVNETINGWSPTAIGLSAASRLTTERPVFIVGMPRSGTTLVERVLGAHPSIAAGGEKSDVIQFVGK